MMIAEEGKERLREDMQRMRAMANSGASLGLGVELGMMVQRGGGGEEPRPCPVQLDLLPLRPLSHSTSSSQVPSSSNNHFTWQPLMASRTNSGSANGDCEVETYTSGGRGASPRGIDVNQIPSTTDCDEAVVSSPSSIGMKRERAKIHEFDLERTCDLSSRGGSDEEDGGTTRKKLRLSKEQSALLEESFKEHSTLNPKQKNALAKQLNLRPRQVEVWFQNRRARSVFRYRKPRSSALFARSFVTVCILMMLLNHMMVPVNDDGDVAREMNCTDVTFVCVATEQS